MAGATMRQIAQEAGYANGALKPYFPTKADLMQATYAHVFARTNERVVAQVNGLTGLAALTAFFNEILPLNSELLDEARVVIAFWSEATNDPPAQELFEDSIGEWRNWLLDWCAEIDRSRSWEAEVDALLSFALGTQITAALLPGATGSVEQLKAQLQLQLNTLVGAP